MKALLSKAPGGPETLALQTVADPLPGPGQVRICVAACGINFPDFLIIQDRYQFKPERPFAPGSEVAGRVDLVGDGVTSIRPGDRVLAVTAWGGLAEKAVVKESSCFGIPDHMPVDEAAAFLMTYGTSRYALNDRARLQPGETLLVLGAAGGVGLAAVELGKSMGARVIGAVSTARKAEIARERGADATIIYPSGDFDRAAARALTGQIKAAAGGEVNVVYDGVGGPYSEPALRTVGWDGRYLVIGFPAGIPSIPLNLPLLKSCSIMGVFWGASVEKFPEAHKQNVAALFALYKSGKLRPLISARYSFERGGEAIAHLASRSALGKVVVMIDGHESKTN
jgi:NADPH2:quinone reductase